MAVDQLVASSELFSSPLASLTLSSLPAAARLLPALANEAAEPSGRNPGGCEKSCRASGAGGSPEDDAAPSSGEKKGVGDTPAAEAVAAAAAAVAGDAVAAAGEENGVTPAAEAVAGASGAAAGGAGTEVASSPTATAAA